MDDIITLLEASGLNVYDTDASAVDFTAVSITDHLPYVLVMGSMGQPGENLALACEDATDSLTIRHVGASAESVRVLARTTRGILHMARISGTGHVSDLAHESTGQIYFDPDLTIEGLATHPHILNDDYRVWTQQI